ncbi:MAG: hypothetical protein ACX931_16985 [Saccharospirillum sp.]|jgi:hypothetical protein
MLGLPGSLIFDNNNNLRKPEASLGATVDAVANQSAYGFHMNGWFDLAVTALGN